MLLYVTLKGGGERKTVFVTDCFSYFDQWSEVKWTLSAAHKYAVYDFRKCPTRCEFWNTVTFYQNLLKI